MPGAPPTDPNRRHFDAARAIEALIAVPETTLIEQTDGSLNLRLKLDGSAWILDTAGDHKLSRTVFNLLRSAEPQADNTFTVALFDEAGTAVRTLRFELRSEVFNGGAFWAVAAAC